MVPGGTIGCPFDGTFLVGASVSFAANATGYRFAQITVNEAPVVADSSGALAGANYVSLSMTTVLKLSAGQIVKLYVLQNSGEALNLNSVAQFSPELWMETVN